MLNQRFNKLTSLFLGKRVHHIDLTSDITSSQMIFIVDTILPHLDDHHQLKSLELCHADLFLRFLDNIDQINTNYLSRIIVTPYVDIQFEFMMAFLFRCSQLNEVKFKVLTNIDKSWANGRKWTGWFEKMLEINRENILKTLDICVYCIETTDVVKFDPRLWNIDGAYRNNRNWKVQLKPDEAFNWQRSRRTVEFSRCDQDYVALSLEKENATCILS